MKALLAAVKRHDDFESRARASLEYVSELANQVIGASEFSGAVCTRVEVHVRADRGYEAFFALIPAEPGGDSVLSSATLWNLLVEKGTPTGLDIALQLIHDLEHKTTRELGSGGKFDLSKSVRLAFERPETHAMVFPLKDAMGAVRGMLLMEYVEPRAMGTPFVFAQLESEIGWVVDLVAPFLLDSRSRVEALRDELLPVVGNTMRSRVEVAARFASINETLLLCGASGVGKSRLARWCHARSSVKSGPFEVLDLLAVPPDMQMAALVGWKKGAFTSAVSDTDGAVARAEGGTLFIDEIDKLSLDTQAGLLRLLEEGRYRPLGSSEAERQAKVRIIVGTNVDLEAAVARGAFREDLLWRVNVLPISLPTLNERRDEVIPWARYMLDKIAGSLAATWEEEALLALEEMNWPGNLRQLNNVVRRTFALATMDPGNGMVLRREHVMQAVSQDVGRQQGLCSAFEEAARVFLEKVQRRKAAGAEVNLDLAEGVRSLVIAGAVQRLGDLGAAYAFFGKETMVKNRNHRRAWAREREILEELGALDAEFLKYLERVDG